MGDICQAKERVSHERMNQYKFLCLAVDAKPKAKDVNYLEILQLFFGIVRGNLHFLSYQS